MAPKRTSSRNSGRKDEGEQSPDDNNNAGVFLSKLAEALSARGSHDWKADEVKVALSTAVESLPNAASKKHIQSKLDHYADFLYEKLSKGATRKKPKRAKKEKAPAPKTAKTTAATANAGIFDPSSSLPAPDTALDDTYFEAIKSFQDKSEEDQFALLLSRAPVPLSFLHAYAHHTIGNFSSSCSNGRKKSPTVADILEQASKATRLVGSLCSLVRDPAAAAASFDVPLAYLSQAVDAATEEGKGEEWSQVGSSILQTIGSVQIAITSATLSAANISSRSDDASTQYDWIGFASQPRHKEDNDNENDNAADVDGNNKSSLGIARRTCGQLVYLHALATLQSAAAGREEHKTTTTMNTRATAQAVLNLKSLSPYGVYGLLEHQLTQRTNTINSTNNDNKSDQLKVRCLVCLYNAVQQCSTTTSKGALQYFTIPEPSGIALYFLRVKAARDIAKLLADSDPVGSASILTRASAGGGGALLPSSSAAQGQVYGATVLSPMDIGKWLESCPPSSVVVSAIKAWKSGNWEGLSAHLILVASERDVDMLFTAAAASSSGIGGGNISHVGDQQDGIVGVDGNVADDMLFYVSTEGDAFNGGWAAARKGGDEDEDEGDGCGEGVLSLLEEMEGEEIEEG